VLYELKKERGKQFSQRIIDQAKGRFSNPRRSPVDDYEPKIPNKRSQKY
jgi:hypothetical protein